MSMDETEDIVNLDVDVNDMELASDKDDLRINPTNEKNEEDGKDEKDEKKHDLKTISTSSSTTPVKSHSSSSSSSSSSRSRSRRYSDDDGDNSNDNSRSSSDRKSRDRDEYRYRDSRYRDRDDYRERDRDRDRDGDRDRRSNSSSSSSNSSSSRRGDYENRSSRYDSDRNSSYNKSSSSRDDSSSRDSSDTTSSSHSKDDPNNTTNTTNTPAAAPIERKKFDALAAPRGGTYIPPGRLRLMQQEAALDKSSPAFQRTSWEALKKSLNGIVNKLTAANLRNLIPEIFTENLVRGRGLLARSFIRAQNASPSFTPVYAALLAIINTKFPQAGELVLKRLVLQFRNSFRRNDKAVCIAATKFIAHLVNQQVAYEIIALQIITLLLERPTDSSVEVAIAFLKECGSFLAETSPRALDATFDRLRSILHDGDVSIRVQYMIEVAFALRKESFKDFPQIPEGLDLVEEEDQITHFVSLDDDALSGEDELDLFKVDPNFIENEEKYKKIKAEILGDDEDEDDDGEEGDDESEEEEEEEEEEKEETAQEETKPLTTSAVLDQTSAEAVNLRRRIYLCFMSSASFEECAHKLLKGIVADGQEFILATMVIECCGQERSYLRFYGDLAQRLCQLKKTYREAFEHCFQEYYHNMHQFETNKIRHLGKLFAQLFYKDAFAWSVLEVIKLTEEDTTSSSRIFLKQLIQELSDYMGQAKLMERFREDYLQPYLAGLFPKDTPRNMRFAINFFVGIGRGGLAEDLRSYYQNAPKMIMGAGTDAPPSSSSSESESESDSDSSSSSSSSDDSSSDSDSGSSDSGSSSSSSSSSSSGSESESDSDDERDNKRRAAQKSTEKKYSNDDKDKRAESRKDSDSKHRSSTTTPSSSSSSSSSRSARPTSSRGSRSRSRSRSKSRSPPPAKSSSSSSSRSSHDRSSSSSSRYSRDSRDRSPTSSSSSSSSSSKKYSERRRRDSGSESGEEHTSSSSTASRHDRSSSTSASNSSRRDYKRTRTSSD